MSQVVGPQQLIALKERHLFLQFLSLDIHIQMEVKGL